MSWGCVVEFAISSDDYFLNIYVIAIHHILTFLTSGDTCHSAFYDLYPNFYYNHDREQNRQL